MQIQISLTQEDIEVAIREYVARAGMTSENAAVNFTVTRKGGQTIEANIDLSSDNGEDETVKAEPAGPVKDTGKKPVTEKTDTKKSFSKQEEVPPKAEKEEEPEPASTEPPFDPDKDTESANDSTEAEPTKESRKLFG